MQVYGGTKHHKNDANNYSARQVKLIINFGIDIAKEMSIADPLIQTALSLSTLFPFQTITKDLIKD